MGCVGGAVAGQQLPESLGVVGVDQVAQLMDSHVIPDGVGGGCYMAIGLTSAACRRSPGTSWAA